MSAVDVRKSLRMVLQHVLICGPDATVEQAVADVDDAVVKLVDALEHARYVGLHIGRDCALALADLQESGAYKPRCSDGKPSNANARRDVAAIEESTAKARTALANIGAAK